ncbi:amidohydrolase [Bacillus piscicola]|uniref:amidohydrolase n=1 Tax=Bacillus piscicola TaxID=1632684 RepID=UPI001F090E2E
MGTLWFNGTIYTMERVGERVEAVLTESGKIQAIGGKEELEKKYKNIDHWHDLQGAVMFPGFTDSHLHMLGLGEAMLRLDLSTCTSSIEMKDLLTDKASLLKPGQWLIGDGWNENHFSDKKIFHRRELDTIAPNNPMLLTRICRHAALANSLAFEKAGITSTTPDPEGGIIVKDAYGENSGYLLDRAVDVIKTAQPQVDDKDLREALRVAVQAMVKKGLTGGHTEDLNYYGGFNRTLGIFRDYLNEAGPKLRMNLLVHHEVVEDMHQLGYEYGALSEYLSFGAVKIFADGALGGRTALLREAYTDERETSGIAIHTRKQLQLLVKNARACKMPVAVHAIGDLALEYVIEALEDHPSPEGVRDRIIHAQMTPPDLVERLQLLSVALDLQPHFVLSDFPWVEERLGAKRISTSFAWKTLIHSGISCAGGSDAPIEPVDPLAGIQAAVTRKYPFEKHEGYLPDQKLTAFEAVSLYTTGSACAIGKETEMGKISPGFLADFTILDRDILTVPAEEIAAAVVKGTVVNEKFQYKGE